MLMKKAKKILGLSHCAALAASSASLSAFADGGSADEYLYGTMKIPYNEFYAAELDGVENVNQLDAVSSATAHHSLETGNGQMLEGVWSEAVSDAGKNKAGNEIAAKLYGVVYPVAVKQAELEAMGENNYGVEQTDKPETYKIVSLDEGKVSFSKVQDDSPENVNGGVTLNCSTPWGDYAAAVEGKPANGTVIYGILIKTADGEVNALRHEQNIWRNGEIAWSSGIKTTEAHGNYLESEGFESLMGNKITEIDYITPAGYVNVEVGEVYVPVKFDGSVAVADTPVSAGGAVITRNNVPEDFVAEYSIGGLDARFDGDGFTFSAADPGAYTLTARDKGEKYADLTASFKLTTSEMPAAYSDDNGSLIAAEGFSDEAFAAFLKNITGDGIEPFCKVLTEKAVAAVDNSEYHSLVSVNAIVIETAFKSGVFQFIFFHFLFLLIIRMHYFLYPTTKNRFSFLLTETSANPDFSAFRRSDLPYIL